MSDQAETDPIGARAPAVYMIKPPTVGLTIAALCFGIPALLAAPIPVAGIILGTFLGVIAIVCGHLGIRKIDYSRELLGGRGMATAGLITGYLGIVIGLGQAGFFILASAALTNA